MGAERRIKEQGGARQASQPKKQEKKKNAQEVVQVVVKAEEVRKEDWNYRVTTNLEIVPRGTRGINGRRSTL